MPLPRATSLRAPIRFVVPLLVLATGLGVAAPVGCDTNQSGRVDAHGTGELGAPLVEKLSSATDRDLPCGPGQLTDAGTATIRRRPYLQQVTTDAAIVVWTASTGGARVRAFTEDPATKARSLVSEARAQVDEDVRLPGGARQLEARLAGLSAATSYCYEIVADDGTPLVGPATLVTAPAADSTAPVRFVAYGDSGDGGSDQMAVARQIALLPHDFAIHMGDIAYDDGTLDQFEQKFFGVYDSLLRSRPMFPASGNHEYNTNDARPFRDVFVLPENGGADGRERWYSFDWGPVHFVALDTERVGETQASWLDSDLTANRRPWVVVYGHRPAWASGERGSDMKVRKTFGPIFERHRVPLVLAGHEHHYERSRPIAGVTYIVSGGGGRGTRSVGAGAQTAYAEAVLHTLQITVDGDTMVVHAVDGIGREFDQAVIRRPLARRR